MFTQLKEALGRLLPGIATVVTLITFQDKVVGWLATNVSGSASIWWNTHGAAAIAIVLAVWIAIEAGSIAALAGHRAISGFGIAHRWAAGEWIYFSHYYDPERVSGELDAFNRKLLPDSFATAALQPERLRAVMRIDSRYVQRVGLVRSMLGLRWRSMRGYYVVAGLTRGARDDILAGKVINGHAIGETMIADDWANADSVYVFGIYAHASELASARVTSALAGYLHDLFARNALAYCFTRGGTAPGRAQMRRFRFGPIAGSQIEAITAAEVTRGWNAHQALFERYRVTAVDEGADAFD